MNCHNGEKYLVHSVRSILQQTYRNWELVFFDNVSNDNSKKIIKSFKDKRIRIFSSKKYLKLYDARNQAINKTKGKYITFLDTDDWWKKDKLQKQIMLLSKNKNAEIIYTNIYVYDQKNKKKIKMKNKLYAGMIAKHLLKKYTISILTVFIKKNIFKNYKFNKNYSIIGDFDLFTRLSLKYPFYKIDEPLAYYRSHENNFSKIKKDEYIKELKHWIKVNNDVFRKNNIKLIHPWVNLKKLQIKKIFKIN